MDLRDKDFIPMTVKEEPMDDSYDAGFTVTDLNDEDIKIEIKNEPIDDSDFFGNVLPDHSVPVVEKSPKSVQKSLKSVEKSPKYVRKTPKSVKEVVKPRRTSRKSKNTLVTQNADALLQKTQILKKTFELEEISCMTGKQLVENFAEVESNEKFFSFTCSIMPEICGNFFISYGSEIDARAKMQRHLMQHVKDLVAEKQKDKKFVFAADTLLLYAADEETSQEEAPPPAKKGRGRKPAARSANKSSKANTAVVPDSLKPESVLDVIDLNDIHMENLLMENQEEEEEEKSKSPQSLKSLQSEKTSPPKLQRKRRLKFYDDEWNVQKKNARGKKEKIVMELSGLIPRRCTVSETTDVNKEKDKFRRHECDGKSPWCLDHTYDIHHYNPLREADFNGKDLDVGVHYYHKFLPAFKTQTISEIQDHMLTRLLFTINPDEASNPAKLIIPILTVSATSMSRDMNGLPNNPMEECDDIDLPPLKFNNYGPLEALKQNLPKGRPEFEVYRELDFNMDITEEEIKAIEALKGNWTGDHIKILSKYYLRELEMNKGKNRRKKALCGCKICPNKKFTAVTTLYYHYISHTGEKPFKCNKCDKGFTRRHSLNYHAMTHSNINRFKCPICLKQFRHTSHYKDHVKHHTGEEECHCKMCNTTFKSRTAFNRHLKTKHNLTITGSNKVSRVLSPSKINQLHNQERAANEDPTFQAMLDNASAASANKKQEIKSEDVPSLMVIKGEPNTDMMDDSMLPSNIIHIQPEDMDCSDFSILKNILKRRKPSILKPRSTTQKS